MKNDILLNNARFIMSESDLPCLIPYADKTGGSHFSVSLMKDFFRSGSKILFFTAYPSARENFMEQIAGEESKVAYIIDTQDLTTEAQVIIPESWNEALFVEVCKTLPDISERVVLVKNIETFGQEVFDVCLPLQKIILSGNIDTCIAKEQIVAHPFASVVMFAQPQIDVPYTAPTLQKWQAYMWGNRGEWFVHVDMNE